jgi:hypothetical protein
MHTDASPCLSSPPTFKLNHNLANPTHPHSPNLDLPIRWDHGGKDSAGVREKKNNNKKHASKRPFQMGLNTLLYKYA